MSVTGIQVRGGGGRLGQLGPRSCVCVCVCVCACVRACG